MTDDHRFVADGFDVCLDRGMEHWVVATARTIGIAEDLAYLLNSPSPNSERVAQAAIRRHGE